MKDETKLRDEAWRGEQAKMILSNPLIVEYFDNARTGIMQKLEESEVNKRTEREMVRMLKVLGNFERDFKKKIRTGYKAQTILNKLLKR